MNRKNILILLVSGLLLSSCATINDLHETSVNDKWQRKDESIAKTYTVGGFKNTQPRLRMVERVGDCYIDNHPADLDVRIDETDYCRIYSFKTKNVVLPNKTISQAKGGYTSCKNGVVLAEMMMNAISQGVCE